MTRVVAIVFVVSVFCTGVLVGGLAMHLYYAREVELPALVPAPAPAPGRPLPIERFYRVVEPELGLTDEQRSAIEAVLARARTEAAAERRRAQPDILGVTLRVGDAIEQLLTPEQRRLFQQRREEVRRQMRRPPARERPSS